MRRPLVDVRRSGDRPRTKLRWLDSRHSFSFGQHYDERNTHHGVLLAHNEDIVLPGAGFDMHPHRDMEIVTWVLRGSLVHQDSEGNSGLIYPGLAQRMSAGTGILHSETNDSWRLSGAEPHQEPVHFVQMWVLPDEPGGTPGYEQREVDRDLAGGELVPVASGLARRAHTAAIRIKSSAALHVARLAHGQSVRLPDAPYLHFFLASGAAELEDIGRVDSGDAVRFAGVGGHRVTAVGPAELLVWEMHSGLG